MQFGYFDRNGQPMTLHEWARRCGDLDYERVALYEDGKIRISTVWLGLDHRYDDDGPPLIFETMSFPAGTWAETGCWRWATEAEALAGHGRIVSAYLAGGVDVT